MSDTSDHGDDEVQLSIQLFHGGELNILHTEYIGGKLTVYDYCDNSDISLESLLRDVRALGYMGLMSLYYRIPGRELEDGLVLIKSDEEVQNMKGLAMKNRKRIDVFVKHNIDDIFIADNPYENICPDEHNQSCGGSNGVGDYSDEVDDYSFIDSEYSISEDDDQLYKDNIDEGAEWIGRVRGNLGLESDGGASDSDDEPNSNSSEEFNSMFDEDAGKVHPKIGEKLKVYKDCEDPKFEVGMIFKDHYHCREAITKHSYVEGRRISFVKSDRKRVKAVCTPPCKWIAFASLNWDKTFQLKKVGPGMLPTPVLESKPNCLSYILDFWKKKYINEFRINPKWPIAAFHKTVIQDLSIDFPAHVLRRARASCMKKINGNDADQYAKLWDYRSELLKRNPNSTIEFEFESGSPGMFKRMYVCFGGTKSGFKLGCRKVIGLDGTHIKSQYKGQLLCAVSVDANNAMYPLCYAVVESEKLDSWGWFVDLLSRDFELDSGYGWTLISDRQKGLINVVEKLLPAAEHRFCVRHMHNNFKQKYRGKSLKDKLWAAARAPNVESFKSAMDHVKAESEGAYEWLAAIPPHHWSRSHFKTDNKCDILLNNMCEAFNKAILLAREQRILVMLEMIRDYLMLRLQTKRDKMRLLDNKRFTPKCLKLIEKFKKWTKGCYPGYCGYNQFEVTTVSGMKFAVNLNEWTCGCRRWDLTGIPCHHAISCMNRLRLDPEAYVDPCYSVATYKKCYSGIIFPMNGEGLWEKTGFVILPPKIEVQPGRPKRKRRNDGNDVPMSYEKDGVQILRRTGQGTIRCGLCKENGHNRVTCPQRTTEPTNEESSNAQKKRKKNSKNTQETEVHTNPGGGASTDEGNRDVLVDVPIAVDGGNTEPRIPINTTENEAQFQGGGVSNDEGDRGPVLAASGVGDGANTEPHIPVNTTDEVGHFEGGGASNEEGDREPVLAASGAVDGANTEDNEEEIPIDVAARKIKEYKAMVEGRKQVSWYDLITDLRLASEIIADRMAQSAMRTATEDREPMEVTSKPKTRKTVSAEPRRRSQRLVAQSGPQSQCLSGFKNTPDSAIVLDDDEVGGSGGSKRNEKMKVKRPAWNNHVSKNTAPPNYTGPNLVGAQPSSPIKQLKAKVGGIVIKTKGQMKDGKTIITRQDLQLALANSRRNKQKAVQDSDCNEQHNP